MVLSTRTRRDFLTGRSPEDPGRIFPPGGIFPPGATETSVRSCSGCGACVDACPTKIISIRAGVPVVDFSQGECTFCGQCAERCPETVFPAGPAAGFAHHALIDDGCLANNYVDCQACRDSCPEGAIRFWPRLGGPFVPELDAHACTGCGACISVCPADAIVMKPRHREAAHG
ncbi:ferredoxin-type protein NapF [Rhizobium viscosum]|uniref:Ferredoxin-type protein NapF n=1 Tax=Rhizobium viscosum TaxID=1673 RepID=A0ABR9IUP4_RHIVS|nr:ferredoxin-type protein NapF [Rhizobium viscosum]MBE1506830.1 ferredoxin-type protein NapF [Rhizobium viscosum]